MRGEKLAQQLAEDHVSLHGRIQQEHKGPETFVEPNDET